MKREVVDCDKCGAKGIPPHGGSILIHTGYTYGGSSGGEKEFASFDLCPQCLASTLQMVIEQQCVPEYRTILTRKLRAKR